MTASDTPVPVARRATALESDTAAGATRSDASTISAVRSVTSPQTDDARPPAPAFPARRPARGAPTIAAMIGLAITIVLSVVVRVADGQNEQRLLQRQTDEAAAILQVSVAQFLGPLVDAARFADVTAGDAEMFDLFASPVVADDTAYGRIALLDRSTGEEVAHVGPPTTLPVERRADVLRKTTTDPVVIVDLLASGRVLGFAIVDDPATSRYVVYAERVLSADPNVRRRTEGPFSDLDYAIYLGGEPRAERLLGASVEQLPLPGRVASTTVPYGDSELLVVGSPIRPLGGVLTRHLWWITLAAGAIASLAAAWVLRRIARDRADAVDVARENARLLAEQRDIAETLQLSLLPRRLDAPPGATVTSRYWAAGTASLIGGDFYDVFRIDDRRWGILIGDVCGKGVEAAALTGLVRHTARVTARYVASPSAVLGEIHHTLAALDPPTFCTACLAVYSPDEPGGATGGELVVALGGHPPPLLCDADGTVDEIGRHGTLLGMVEPDIHDVTVRVRAGAVVLFYTDGLTDAPGDQAVPLDELMSLLVDRCGAPVEEIADEVRRRKRSRRPRGSADDTAVIVFSTASATDRASATGHDAGVSTSSIES